MTVKIGISPIAWQNDDLPDMTSGFTMEQALMESRAIGYTGAERGRRMPHDTEGLRAYLDRYDIALCGGWCSGNLMVNSVADEIAAVRQQVEQFRDLNAPCLVYAECSNTVQGDIKTPVNDRPKLSRGEVMAYGRKLGELAKWMVGEGMPLAYHHHMGSMIEAEDDINWMLEASPVEVQLCFDTGHLVFGGGNIDRVMDNWADRIHHVHFKDIRADVVADVRRNNRSFLDAVIAGAFTVPGDGVIDFQSVANRLRRLGYSGWIVVEAEQDPAKANPKEYSEGIPPHH